MAEISNRTLATLLVAAVVISLVGTLISLDRIGKLGGVTGLVTINGSQSTGTTSVTVAANAEMTLRVDSIAFGSWRINGTTLTKNCTLESGINATTNAGNVFTSFDFRNSTDCIPVTPSASAPHSFELENTGNVAFANVTINATKNGTTGDFITGESSDLQNFRVVEEGNACNDASFGGSGNTTAALTLDNSTVCANFNFTDSQDAFVVQINITLPSTTPAQAATNTITFKGTMV